MARPSKISPILQYQGSAPLLNQLVLRFPVHSDLYLKEKRATEDYYWSTHIQSWKPSNYDFYCHEGDDDDFEDDWIKIDLDFHFRPPKGRFQKLLSGFFPLRRYPTPPTPLTENHFAKKPLAERGGPPPLLTEKIL